MKKTALLAVLILALGGARLVESRSRVAGNDSGHESAPERTVVPFTAEYDNVFGGHFTCEGFRISDIIHRLPRDTEHCTCTDLSSLPPGTYTGHPNYVVNGVQYSWTSDYDGLTAQRVRLIVTDNGDGTGQVDVDATF